MEDTFCLSDTNRKLIHKSAVGILATLGIEAEAEQCTSENSFPHHPNRSKSSANQGIPLSNDIIPIRFNRNRQEYVRGSLNRSESGILLERNDGYGNIPFQSPLEVKQASVSDCLSPSTATERYSDSCASSFPIGKPSIYQLDTSPRKNHDSDKRSNGNRVSKRMIEKRKHVTSLSNLDIRKQFCCKKRRCFRSTDPTFLRSEVSRVLLWGRIDRRRYLEKLFDPSSKVYLFCGRKVCYKFLESSFMFSRHMQRSVKISWANGRSVCFSSAQKDPESPQRDSVICFLDRFADSTAERMPDTNERHLPLFQKKSVYEVFREQYTVLHGYHNIPSLAYFYTTWKKYCGDIKVRRIQRFTKCTDCEYIRDALAKYGTDKKSTAPLLERRRLHIEMVSRERREYQKRCELAALYPSQYTSLIVDGADQSGYGLPHFTVNTKATVGHSLKVRLIGVLEHGARKHLSLYTMTAEFETGANHIVEALHRTLSSKALGSKLQGKLFLQVDNCTRENKNSFLFCYLECLVAWGVYEEIFVSFLPIGHTHSDIDQAFSCTSRRLKFNNAATMEDLHDELRKSFTPEPSVSRMLHIINFSGLCKMENCIGKVKPFSKYRYFRFFRDPETERGSAFFKTACDVKISCDDQWRSLPALTNGLKGFTRSPPNLHAAPCNSVVCPPDKEKILLRLRSEEVRVNSVAKMRSLHALVAQVYRDRDEPLHWNLEECVELNGIYSNQSFSNHGFDEDEENLQEMMAQTDLPYSRNRFVAVNGYGCTKEMPFWLGQIIECIQDGSGVTRNLFIRWYEVYDKGDAWSGKYRPATVGRGKNIDPWQGNISVDTVIAEFDSLTNKKLRAGVEKEIRAGLVALGKY